MRIKYSFSTLIAVSFIAVSACSSNDVDPSNHSIRSDGEGIDGSPAANPSDPAQKDTGASAAASGATLVPSNLPADTCETPATKDLVIDTWLNTYQCDATIVQGGGAPDICVLKGNNVAIHWTSEQTVPLPAFAIVATNQMTVDGTIDFAAQVRNTSASIVYDDGPGAPDPRGEGPGELGSGAGYGTAGAPDGAGGAGGLAYGNETGTPLVGGARGGSPWTVDSVIALGGGGGGALQLVACHQLTITSQGAINAGGGGGSHGTKVTSGPYSTGAPGGGGGSGGTILLEAAQMTIAGGLAANGGSGGGGGGAFTNWVRIDCDSGWVGAPGGMGTSPASGGAAGNGGIGGGQGGQGGSATSAPTAGAVGGDCFYGGDGARGGGLGGSGGAVGRIRLNVPAGSAPNTTGAIISPAASIGTVATH